jgi:ketosteroid isomerase-like protein
MKMRMLILATLIVLCPVLVGPSFSSGITIASPLAQTTDSGLSAELEALHAKWFNAFAAGDGATMDQMEVENLVLVMPTGMAWSKDGPRAGKQPKRDPATQFALSDVVVRQFGDTAVLTGTVTSKTATETDKSSETVVFVRRGGKWLIASAQWTPVAAPK